MKNKKSVKKSSIETKPSFVKLDKIYKDKDWKLFKNKPVIPLGADTPTNNLVGNLENFFNLLICGKKGSGKSTMLHCGMVNLLRNTNPEELRLILIDTSKKDLVLYKNLKNLHFPVITNPDKVRVSLDWCIFELSRRFQLVLKDPVKSPEKYVKFFNDNFPRILVVINNCSELIKKKPKYYKKVLSDIATYGKLAKINLVIATSDISKDTYPPKFIDLFHRVALKTNTKEESKLLIDVEGAEKLKGKGEAIFKFPQKEKESRPMQCFFIGKDEVKKILSSIKN